MSATFDPMSPEPDPARPLVLDAERFKKVMATFPTGVAVVTAIEEGVPVGFTCQSIVSLSLEPPLVALAPAKSSTSWPRIARAGVFCVNVLSSSQGDLAERFSAPGGDKFSGVSWEPAPSGAPILDGVLSFVDCGLELAHDAGDHEIVIGKVRDLGLRDLSAGPLVFYRSSYGRLEDPPG